MITTLTIGNKPISFTFTQSDIINLDEAKSVLTLADAVNRTYTDKIDDGDDTTEVVSISNTFPTLRNVYVPYLGANVDKLDGTVVPVFTYIEDKVRNNVPFSINVSANVTSLSDSKIITESSTFAEA